MNQLDGITAARTFAETYYRDCVAALLCGSVARGEATPNSDLDILIVTAEEGPFHRKTYRDHGWFVEAFVAPRAFYEEKLLQRGHNRNPSMLRSFAEAMILKDRTNFAQNLKEKAIETLEQGPAPLTPQERDQYRYIITDWLDDLADSTAHAEALFIGADLIAKSAELLLAYNQKWSGERRWLYRALEALDHELANQLVAAASEFYRTGRKDRLIEATESILNLVGGRLYEGYSRIG
jgi:predicted nucleotidyltransferase